VFRILHEVPKGADGDGWRTGTPDMLHVRREGGSEARSDPQVWPGEGLHCLPGLLLSRDEIQAAGKRRLRLLEGLLRDL